MLKQDLEVFIAEVESSMVTRRAILEIQLGAIPKKYLDATDVQQLRKDISFLSGKIIAYREILAHLVEQDND